jgi:hypothetical protein
VTDGDEVSFGAEVGATAGSLLILLLESHQLVIPAMVTPTPTNTAIREWRGLRLRTGSESLGKGDDESTSDADSLSPGGSTRSGSGGV